MLSIKLPNTSQEQVRNDLWFCCQEVIVFPGGGPGSWLLRAGCLWFISILLAEFCGCRWMQCWVSFELFLQFPFLFWSFALLGPFYSLIVSNLCTRPSFWRKTCLIVLIFPSVIPARSSHPPPNPPFIWSCERSGAVVKAAVLLSIQIMYFKCEWPTCKCSFIASHRWANIFSLVWSLLPCVCF